MEQLEPRQMLSAAGLVDVGEQPQGGLTDKIVYTHAGHGWTAANQTNGAWTTQRPETFEMVEDFGNQDQMSLYADYLFQAGATVVPLRPIGHQTNEVILDNDDVTVTYDGDWSNANGTRYFGDAGDVPYRFATTSTTQTAVARYTPNLPQAGTYPIYTWVAAGNNRAADQLYRITHSGGTTEVTVNHRRVGFGLVYLGSYHFDAGNNGFVEISNQSEEADKVVIADMIRFGNGMGDINRGGGVSGVPREDESGLYWIKWHVDHAQGIPDSAYRASSNDRSAAVSFSPRYAAYMNQASDGALSDRVFISFHSNAGGGNARGVLGLYNGNNTPSSATPNQQTLALSLANEVNQDLVNQASRFEHNWANRSVVTLDRSDIEFGEINNAYINNEFDATIVETGFHDNQTDAEMLRDPRVRDALAKATYQGTVRYFHNVDAGTTPLAFAPAKITNLRTSVDATGEATLHWDLPEINSFAGGVPTGYYVYGSTDGYGFDGGTYVAGTSNRSHTFTGLDLNEGAYYFKVVAANAAGQGPASQTVAAVPIVSNVSVLVVNGFNRFDRRLSPVESYLSGSVQRVRPQLTNSMDYVVQHAEAIAAYDGRIQIESTANENIINGSVDLDDYDAVVWILGEESTADETFNASEQTAVVSYLENNGKLFLSGSEIGWELPRRGQTAFYSNTLRATYVADDANTYQTAGVAGSIFAGVDLSFDDGSLFYDVTFPDVISPASGSTPAMTYVGGTGGTSAIQHGTPATSQLVMLAFPFETISTSSNRDLVMERALQFFELKVLIPGDFDEDGTLGCGDLQTLGTAIQTLSNESRFDLNSDTTVDGLDLEFWITQLKQTSIGDANLDLVVDSLDFQIWNANRFASGTDWCSGDFNVDGITDVSDLNIWNTYRSNALATITALAAGNAASLPDDETTANENHRNLPFARVTPRQIGDGTIGEPPLRILWDDLGVPSDRPFVGPLPTSEFRYFRIIEDPLDESDSNGASVFDSASLAREEFFAGLGSRDRVSGQ